MEPVPTKRAFSAESSTKIGSSSEYATSEALESSIGRLHWQYPVRLFRRLLYRLEVQKQQSQPWLWRTQTEKLGELFLTDGLNRQN